MFSRRNDIIINEAYSTLSYIMWLENISVNTIKEKKINLCIIMTKGRYSAT